MTYGGPEALLARVVSTGKIVRFRGHDLSPDKSLESLRQRLSYQSVSLALVPSETLARKLQGLLSTPIVRPIVLGCDTARFRYRPEAWQSHERAQALVLGRFDPVKGHGELMRIWAQVLRGWSMGPKPLLHIVGEPANLSVQDLAAAAASAGLILGRDVRITAERVADVSSLLSGATIGIVPSLGSELICRVAEEFLLCGTPVIVSGVGSLNEVLFDESAGASYQGLDHHGAAALMGGWLQKAFVEETETRAARALTAKRFFSFETMGETLEAELRRL
jgi:glycosyltransferase involved in cell wall biosynthesis